MQGAGTIQLVDYRDRSIATLSLRNPAKAEPELLAAVARWRAYDVFGGYARDHTGKLLAYC